MGLFSKELRELDRNTVQYMIDEMQEEIDASKKMLEEQTRQLKQQELENQLYGLLSRDGRLEDLGRAVADLNDRKKLLEEYRLHL